MKKLNIQKARTYSKMCGLAIFFFIALEIDTLFRLEALKVEL